MSSIEQGCIDIWIDEIVPCLKDTETGDIKETVVFKIQSRAYLKKFQKSNGWHINWNEIPKMSKYMPSPSRMTIQFKVWSVSEMIKILMLSTFIGHVPLLIIIYMNMAVKNISV